MVSILTKPTKTWQKRIHSFLEPFCRCKYPRNCSIWFQILAVLDVLSHKQGSPLCLPLLLQPPPQARWLPKLGVSPEAPGAPFPVPSPPCGGTIQWWYPGCHGGYHHTKPLHECWQSCTSNKKDVKFTVISDVNTSHGHALLLLPPLQSSGRNSCFAP